MFFNCFGFSMRTFLFIAVWMICLQSYQVESTEKSKIPVTHEDIRDVILMMMRVMASTESKLQRHEMRERIFSQHLRRSLVTLDKRLNKMDEKISKLLDTGNEGKDVVVEINDSLNKIPLAINDLKADIMHKFNSNAQKISVHDANPNEKSSTIIQPKPVENGDSSEEDDEASSAEKIQSLTNQMVTLQKDLSEIKGVQMKSYELIEKMQMNLKNKDQIFENILNKLEENNLEVPPQDAAIPSDWQIELMDALERQESFMEMTLAQVKNIRNESLNEMKFLEESIKDITNNSGVYLEKAMKDLVKIQNSSEAKMGNLTSELDRLNLVLEDVRETVSEGSKTDQKEIFELYLNDSIKTLEKICNNQNATNKILEEINEVKILEGSIEDMTNQSKLFLENIVKDFGETKNLRTGEISNLIGKMDILNLVMEELRETISESYSNKVCGKEDANKILEALKEQNVTIFEKLGNIKPTLDDSIAMSSENNSTDQILQVLDTLVGNVESNTDRMAELRVLVDKILINEDQTLEFNRKSSQEVINMVETLMLNMEVNCNNNL